MPIVLRLDSTVVLGLARRHKSAGGAMGLARREPLWERKACTLFSHGEAGFPQLPFLKFDRPQLLQREACLFELFTGQPALFQV